MKRCDAIQQRLAEDGVAIAEQDVEIRRHLETCDDCTRFAADLKRVEAGLDELPSPDASDALVAATLDAVRRTPRTQGSSAWADGRRRYVAGALAAGVVIAASVVLTLNVIDITTPFRTPDQEHANAGDAMTPAGEETQFGFYRQKAPQESLSLAEPPQSRTEIVGAIDESSRDALVGARRFDNENKEFEMAELAQKEGQLSDLRTREAGRSYLGESEIIAQLKNQRRDDDFRYDITNGNRGEQESRSGSQVVIDIYDTPLEDVIAEGAGSVTGPADDKSAATKSSDKGRAEGFSDADPSIAGEAGAIDRLSSAENAPVGGLVLTEENKRRNVETSSTLVPARQPADEFLAAYSVLDGLTFQEPTGYWSNTYIPGDPEMRLLQARLAAWNREALGSEVRLEHAVRPVVQPFDAPRDAALAVYLDADAAAIDGETRLRLQVGLKGAERQGGHRPAMNIGVVLDLRSGVDADTATRVRALITALERMDQPGDRFSLTVAGPNGGLLIAPDQFKHGPLQVTLDRLFGAAPSEQDATVGLPEAVALAAESVRQGDDPNAILGSSLVLLVTGDSLAGDIGTLERMTHRNAIGGVPLSVVSLGKHDVLEYIDRLVAAGQGSRRILAAPAEAMALIDRELHAASRVVARAVRLRIRLAPGVELIDVLGSRPLAETQAERVREAEQAIDRRLARNLGIEADRGEDEEGIQIVIPNFYAGDSHVVLLDVVADAPGPIADVTLRYKDVIGLRNGVTRASLAIGGGQQAAGPLQRNVLKNLVAWEVAEGTRDVGRYLASGDVPLAIMRLTALRDLVAGLRQTVTGWSSDPDLADDEAVLAEYLAALNSPAIANAVHRHYLAESLRYAAYRKLQVASR